MHGVANIPTFLQSKQGERKFAGTSQLCLKTLTLRTTLSCLTMIHIWDFEVHQDRGKEYKQISNQMPQKNFRDQMAATYPTWDIYWDRRCRKRQWWRGRTPERKRNRGCPKNNMAADGRGWAEQCRLELLERGRPYSPDRHKWKDNVQALCTF